MTTIRPATPADREELKALKEFAFVGDPTREAVDRALSGLDPARTAVAEHPDLPGRLAGLYSSFALQVRVPGAETDDGGTRTAAVDGLTWVSVHPDVRRRGVLRAMMTDFLHRARERGEVIAGLHASEPGIYGRFGFGVASHDVRYTLSRGTRFDAPDAVAAVADATTTLLVLDVDDEEVADRIHAVDAAQSTLGTVVVPRELLRRRLRDAPATRVGTEPLRAVVARRDGVDVGWAVFTRSLDWGETGVPDGTLTVRHLSAVDPGALLALGRRLVDADLMSRVRLRERGLDDLLLTWAGAVRARSVAVTDGLWLRPVDIGGMLTARGYTAPLDVALAVTDPTCPWNEGTWRLVADAHGEARCERTDRPADAHVDVRALGELFLGLTGPVTLVDAGRLTAATPGVVTALTRAFASGTHPIGGSGF